MTAQMFAPIRGRRRQESDSEPGVIEPVVLVTKEEQFFVEKIKTAESL